jgi:ATP-dependent DNA helicase RecQ
VGHDSGVTLPTPADALRRHFGHPSFRPGQEEVVRAALDGHDLLAVMPTGSGKSIGFQLPALLLEGLTLVVSPLIALMKDQVDELTRKGIRAAALNSGQGRDENQAAIRAARDGTLDLLYVAPERFASEGFARLIQETSLARFAVDEAHCVSEWGHDFRTDYLRLKEAAAWGRRADGQPGRPPILAFTATATPEVRADIVMLLGLESPKVFVSGFDRPNLHPEVIRVSGEIEKRRLLPDLVRDRRALVYAATRKSTERAAEALTDAGVVAAAYHAGLEDAERTRVQEGFASGRIPVVCATNAFGMGIDRPDVDAVVHFEIPGSIEAYYQEIGRGGRDGRAARITLLWNYVDVRTREFLIDRDDDDPVRLRDRPPVTPAQRERRRELDRLKLSRMVAYADAAGCLRARLLRYFGEEGVPDRCGNCGICSRTRTLSAEELLLVRKILSGVARGGERWGKRKILAMLRGEVEELPESLSGLSTTGLLADVPARDLEDWMNAATGGGLLRATDDVYRTLSLTREGREVMSGKSTGAELPVPAARTPKAAAGKSRRRTKERAAEPVGISGAREEKEIGESVEIDAGLLDRLRSWRREAAVRKGVPAYVVFHDRTLEAIAAARPSTLDRLAELHGIGSAKLGLYGEEILALVTRD